MLQVIPTTKGTGIKLMGDIGDLQNLHATFWKLFKEDSLVDKERTRILTVMAYEIRHAFQGDRLKETVFFGDIKTVYYGCKVDWVTLLYTISCLRDHASYVILDELDHSNLLLLEYWCRKALFTYDPLGANNIQYFINAGIDTHDELVYHIHQKIVNKFFAMRSGKVRFRQIPSLIMEYSGHTNMYKIFKSNLQILSKESNCTINEIELDYSEINIVW